MSIFCASYAEDTVLLADVHHLIRSYQLQKHNECLLCRNIDEFFVHAGDAMLVWQIQTVLHVPWLLFHKYCLHTVEDKEKYLQNGLVHVLLYKNENNIIVNEIIYLKLFINFYFTIY